MSIADRIQSEITTNDVILFMKGTPAMPQCGFSATVVQVLNRVGVAFKGVDVLADAELRDGIKTYSTGRQFRSFTSKENLSAAPTLPARCIKAVSCWRCWKVRASRPMPLPKLHATT